MKPTYFAPTEIIFGWGRFNKIGGIAARYGKTLPW
jgi:hypothetical protein